MSEARPDLHVRHLLLCRRVAYDPFSAGAAYSLDGLIVSLQPQDDLGYPFASEEIAVFAQVFGDPGEYLVWVEVFALNEDAERDERIFAYKPPPVRVRPHRFVDEFSVTLHGVTFPRPGIYEFLLRRDGDDEPLITERLLLKE